MLLRFRPRLTFANVVSLLALFVALCGGALAAATFVGPDGQIHGCVDGKGHLTLLKAGKKCGKHKSKIAWNQLGPRGLQGLTGSDGKNGSDGTARAYGLVAENGTLTRSKNATVHHTPGNGIYCIQPAAGIDPTNTVLVVTPDFANDDTGIGSTNGSQAVVEWDSVPSDCPAGQMEVATGKRSQSGTAPVNSVNLTASDEPFSFAIP
jgi:hypothetical protein